MYLLFMYDFKDLPLFLNICSPAESRSAVSVTHSGLFSTFSQASLVSDLSVLAPPTPAVTGDFSFSDKAELCVQRPVKRAQSSVLGC